MNRESYRDLDRRLELLEKKSNLVLDRGYPAGAVFPTGMASGFLFYRTDLNWLCYFDGTRWLTTFELSENLQLAAGITNPKTDASYVLNQSIAFNPSRNDYGIYFTQAYAWLLVATTNNGTNYWEVQITNTGTVCATFSTVADAANTNLYKEETTALAVGTGTQYWQLRTSNNVGAPGNLSFSATVFYRLIVT